MSVAVPEDGPFLMQLFAEEKEGLFRTLPSEGAHGILDMQFKAKESFYLSTYPNALRRIIAWEGLRIGSIVTSVEAGAVHIVDIAILKSHRSRGIGTTVVQGVIREAATAGLPVTLSVRLGNPAATLYERLGFREVSRSEMDLSMRREFGV